MSMLDKIDSTDTNPKETPVMANLAALFDKIALAIVRIVTLADHARLGTPGTRQALQRIAPLAMDELDHVAMLPPGTGVGEVISVRQQRTAPDVIRWIARVVRPNGQTMYLGTIIQTEPGHWEAVEILPVVGTDPATAERDHAAQVAQRTQAQQEAEEEAEADETYWQTIRTILQELIAAMDEATNS